MLIKVKNLHNTSEHPKPAGYSALGKFWLDSTNHTSLGICRCCGKKLAAVGGHVIKDDSLDRSWYITPLCSSCNSPNNNATFFVNQTDLVRLRQ